MGGGIWTDITATYAGLYFRAEGTVGGTDNSSGAFNAGGVTVQGEGLPNITGRTLGILGHGQFVFASGALSNTHDWMYTGYGAGYQGGGLYNSDYMRYIDFNAWDSNHIYGSSAHVTPVNTAIRIWKRTS